MEISRRQKIEDELREASEAAKLRLQTGTGTQEEYKQMLSAFTAFLLTGELGRKIRLKSDGSV